MYRDTPALFWWEITDHQLLLHCSFGMIFYYCNEEDKYFKTKSQGLKNVPSGSPKQVDFLAGQVAFKADWVQVGHPLIKSLGSLRNRTAEKKRRREPWERG